MTMWHALWAAPAAMGMAIMFNVRPRALPIVAIIALLAKTMVIFSEEQGVPLIAASFIAAFFVGTTAYTLAPRLGEASPVFAFAPVIPLIPGALIAKSFIYGATTWLAEPTKAATEYSQQFITTVSLGVSAAAVIVALCLGAISPMLLMPGARSAED